MEGAKVVGVFVGLLVEGVAVGERLGDAEGELDAEANIALSKRKGNSSVIISKVKDSEQLRRPPR